MSTVTPRQLSRELRTGRGPELARRRWVVGLSLLGAAMGQAVGLYQVGVVRRLPDLPVGPFDANRVDASDYAYQRLETPDGLLMVANYALTAILAGAGGRDRARERPWLPLALAAKTLYDSATALRLAREEWDDNEALCGYCQTATLASIASVALALPEAIEAASHLLGGDGDGRRGRAGPVDGGRRASPRPYPAGPERPRRPVRAPRPGPGRPAPYMG